LGNGFKIDSEKDPAVFLDIKKYVDDIWGLGKPLQNGILNAKKSMSQQSENTGYCIRCRTPMVINPNKPLCSTCFEIWAKFSNRKFIEKYCHICGKESAQSINKPICYSCKQKLKDF